jgi:hypothetical protein
MLNEYVIDLLLDEFNELDEHVVNLNLRNPYDRDMIK